MHRSLVRLRDRGFSPTGILDIGAYAGAWARGARHLFPDAFILMIDALPERKRQLVRTAAEIGNAQVLLALLGDSERAASEFFVVNAGETQTGSSRYRENTSFPVETRIVPQRSMRSVLGHSPRQYQLAKLDIQGSELDVLSGWGPRLDDLDAILLEISVAQYNQDAPLAQEVFAAMASYGFVFCDIADQLRFDGHLIQFDGLFVRRGSTLMIQPPF